MAYTKQTWTTGDTVTADKLNHIESGIEGASSSSSNVVVVHVTWQDEVGTLDKTAAELLNAGAAGAVVLDNQEEGLTGWGIGYLARIMTSPSYSFY